MAAPKFRSVGTWSFTATNVATPTTLTPGAPAGVAAGDLLILVCESTSNTATVATPSGWNLVSGFPKASGTSVGGTFYVFTRIATGSGDTPSPVWSGLTTGTSGTSSGAGILAYQFGTETLDGTVQVSDLSAQTTTSVIPAFTTAKDNTLVIGAAMKILESAGQSSTVATFTERADNLTASGLGHTIEVCEFIKIHPPGSSGTATVTWSATTSARALTISLGLQCAPVSGVGALASTESFGTPDAVFVVQAQGIATSQAFGRPTLASAGGATTVTAVGAIPSGEAFGGAILYWVRDAFGIADVQFVVKPVALASGEAFGRPSLSVTSTGFTITAAGAIASAETFGTTRLIRIEGVTGIASAQGFGTTHLNRIIKNAGAIPTSETWGQATHVLRIAAAVGIASAQTFGTTHLVRIVGPLGVVSSEAFGRPSLTFGVIQLSAVGAVASSEAFGQATHVRFVVGAIGITTREAFGTPTKSPQVVFGQGIASSQTFGIANVRFIVKAIALASSEAWGKPTLTFGVITLTAAGHIASSETFGQTNHVLFVIRGIGITSSQAFGTPQLPRLVQRAGAIVTAETFGQADKVRFVAAPVAINTAQAFGTTTVRFVVYSKAITSAEVFGVTTLSSAYNIFSVGRIASSETFGQTTHVQFLVRGTGIPTAQAFGTPTTPRLLQRAGAILTAEAHGTAHIRFVVGAQGIPSREAFGTPTKSPQIIWAQGVPSGEAWGLPTVFDATIRAASAFGGLFLTDILVYALDIIDSTGYGLQADTTQVYGQNVDDTLVYDQQAAGDLVYAGQIDDYPGG